MNHRFLASMSALGVVTVLVLLTPILIAGQAPLSMAKTRTPPRTPDGKPDLHGIWTNATVTPLERPRDLAGKEFLTETEAAEFEKLVLNCISNRYGVRSWAGGLQCPSRHHR